MVAEVWSMAIATIWSVAVSMDVTPASVSASGVGNLYVVVWVIVSDVSMIVVIWAGAALILTNAWVRLC